MQATLVSLQQKLAAQELAHKEEERRWREELETAARLGERRCLEDGSVKRPQGDGNEREVAESKGVVPERQEVEGFDVGAGQEAVGVDALDPSCTPPSAVGLPAMQSPKSSHSQHGADTNLNSVVWKGEGEGTGGRPVGCRPTVHSNEDASSRTGRQGKVAKEDKLGGLGEAVEGLGRASSELLGGVWGGLGGLVGINSGADARHQSSAVRSRVATIEEVESSLDQRTREAVRGVPPASKLSRFCVCVCRWTGERRLIVRMLHGLQAMCLCLAVLVLLLS